ncbi:hypothetical protein [Lysobacter sp. TAB13]
MQLLIAVLTPTRNTAFSRRQRLRQAAAAEPAAAIRTPARAMRESAL